jgi:hypothetical protein
MGGFSFETIERGPFATVEIYGRNLVLEAMVAVDAGWVIRGEECPDCMYAHITRASAVHALTLARAHVEKTPRMFARDRTRWVGGGTTREVFFRTIDYLLEELEQVTDPVIIITDDYKLCEHPKMRKPKTRVRKAKE